MRRPLSSQRPWRLSCCSLLASWLFERTSPDSLLGTFLVKPFSATFCLLYRLDHRLREAFYFTFYAGFWDKVWIATPSMQSFLQGFPHRSVPRRQTICLAQGELMEETKLLRETLGSLTQEQSTEHEELYIDFANGILGILQVRPKSIQFRSLKLVGNWCPCPSAFCFLLFVCTKLRNHPNNSKKAVSK